MPGGDRTGPQGMGPMTGRGLGYCGGQGGPGGRRGGGRGYRHQFYATGLTGWQRAAREVPEPPAPATPPQAASRQDELARLRTQADAAAAPLPQLRQRIDELTAPQDSTPSNQ